MDDELNEEDLLDVSGGYIGVDTNIENRYTEINKKARKAYKEGKKITEALSPQDWNDLATFYDQIQNPGTFYDNLRNMIDEQANGRDYRQYVEIWDNF